MRDAVGAVRLNPRVDEDSFQGKVGLYDRVRITGVQTSTRGVAVRVSFSLVRVKKVIIWEQSKRLITGSVVALTAKDDLFSKRAIIATVMARPLENLRENPPEIYLSFAKTYDLEIDPAKEFLMVESRGTYFEADRHTLLSLQHMSGEKFPLSEHLIEVQPIVSQPKFIKDFPMMDLSHAFGKDFSSVNILSEWPSQPGGDMDTSQCAALSRILTKRLAVIQGPPGTGKTFVSVLALKIMLANWKVGNPPIIILAQTNHAVDQIARLVLEFEPRIVRIGGQSKDEVVKKQTLYEARNKVSVDPPPGCQSGKALKRMKQLEREIEHILQPLLPSRDPMDPEVLQSMGLLSEIQARSLVDGASRWQSSLEDANSTESAFHVWLSDALTSVSLKPQAENYDFQYEDAEIEFEQLKDAEQESASKDDEPFEKLFGPELDVCDNFTCRPPLGKSTASPVEMLKKQDMWDIPEESRGSVYRYLQTRMKEIVTQALREKTRLFDEQAQLRKIGRWERDENILKEQKVIAMTTTGFSKYRALISALAPRTIMCEEAAEVLEAPVAVTCIPSLQQLILVGDHAQLRPHTQCRDLDDEPFHLNISLFERLVNNKVEFTTLKMQRRMAPEIRRLLYPIYKGLIEDHISVTDRMNRPDVPGMGGVNSLWFTHEWPESRDDLMSSRNLVEARMIRGFVEYLVMNGVTPSNITCLTFYNGQRKVLLKEFHQSEVPGLRERRPIVVTVDSYQGEENEVVLLSLVRSNRNASVGFLSNDNRACVALSRARCGFYIFGNGRLLFDAGCKTWKSVLTIMAGQGKVKKEIPRHEPSRVSQCLTVTCQAHRARTKISDPSDWETIMGGCKKPCDGTFSCGHPCVLTCHPFSHDLVQCVACPPPRPKAAKGGSGRTSPRKGEVTCAQTSHHSKTHSQSSCSSHSSAWQEFAGQESKRFAAGILSTSASSSESFTLIDIEKALPDVDQQAHVTTPIPSINELPSHAGTVEMIHTPTRIDGNGKQRIRETFRVERIVTNGGAKDWSKEPSLLDFD